MRKIVEITLWTLFLAGLAVLLGFIGAERQKTTARDLEIVIDYGDAVPLITQNEVREIIIHHFDTLKGRRIKEIDLARMEETLSEIDLVRRADVCVSIQGDLEVRILQRRPILRVINARGESFYLDETGRTVSHSIRHPVRLPVASGHIPQSPGDTILLTEEPNSAAEDALHELRMLYRMAQYIDRDPFLTRQIDQIYVSGNGDLELIPKLGRHVILFGKAVKMEQKFYKLKAFYRKGIPGSGWHAYSRINLKYENQVVCSK